MAVNFPDSGLDISISFQIKGFFDRNGDTPGLWQWRKGEEIFFCTKLVCFALYMNVGAL